jgi:acyl-CoA dehydrogenase
MTPVSQLRGPSREHLAWPFFDFRHGEYAAALDAFAAGLGDTHSGNVDETCRSLVRRLGAAGLLEASVAGDQPDAVIDSRLICIARETLAWHSGLADFAFAMQGLGTGAVAIAGSPELRALVLPKARRGEWVAAFALSEKEAGSDVAAMACSVRREGDHYILDGEKTWISNGGIADVYTLFARTGEAPGARGISAFVVLPDDPGFSIADRIDVMAPHPLATLRFEGCRIPAARLLGFARRALDEATLHARTRRMFGGVLGDQQLTQAALGDMAAGVDASALLTYRAAWRRDVQKASTTREAAMAKMVATETAQEVIDRAVQMFGGRGVRSGEIVEQLYREIRALRIYEGATEVQKLIIGRDVLKA